MHELIEGGCHSMKHDIHQMRLIKRGDCLRWESQRSTRSVEETDSPVTFSQPDSLKHVTKYRNNVITLSLLEK